jgi:hypothetical protein
MTGLQATLYKGVVTLARGNRIKCSVELLPSMDQIYGDSEHPMTEIDVEAEQIYARWSRRWGTVQMLETWLDQPQFPLE